MMKQFVHNLYARALKTPLIGYWIASMEARRLVATYSLDFPIWGEGTVRENVDEALKLFSSCGLSLNAKRLSISMVRDYLHFGATPKEYFLFDFQHKTYKEKASFLPDQLKDQLSLKYSGYERFKNDLQDKFHFYELLSPFFKRKAMKLSSKTPFEAFEVFCKSAKRVFIKPLSGSYGMGAQIYDYSSSDDCKRFLKQLIADNRSQYMLEAVIVQDEVMAQFNSSSVNTVRIPTIMNHNGFHILGAFIRTGRKGNIIDNAGGGGVLSAIDAQTGRVISDGMDEQGKKYKVHPDSKIPFKGFVIPHWKELTQIAEQAHRQLGGGKT